MSMDSPLWKILGFFLAAVLLFLVPVMNMLERQDDAAYTVVFTETNRFVDSARDAGYITPNMYNEFVRRLNATGCTFDIRMEHVQSLINPVYRQNGTVLEFTGEYEINRISRGEDAILSVLFPDEPGPDVFDKARRYDMKAGDCCLWRCATGEKPWLRLCETCSCFRIPERRPFLYGQEGL